MAVAFKKKEKKKTSAIDPASKKKRGRGEKESGGGNGRGWIEIAGHPTRNGRGGGRKKGNCIQQAASGWIRWPRFACLGCADIQKSSRFLRPSPFSFFRRVNSMADGFPHLSSRVAPPGVFESLAFSFPTSLPPSSLSQQWMDVSFLRCLSIRTVESTKFGSQKKKERNEKKTEKCEKMAVKRFKMCLFLQCTYLRVRACSSETNLGRGDKFFTPAGKIWETGVN